MTQGLLLTQCSGASGTVANILALDGTGAATGTSSFATLNLTTANSCDIVILCIEHNGNSIVSVTDTASLAWAQRATNPPSSNLATWHAVASSPLSSDTITVTLNANGFYSLSAFGVSGANTTTRFDPNAAIPATSISSEVDITTTNSNTFCFAAYRGGLATMAAGAGWTTIKASAFMLVEYQIVSTPQSSLVATITTGASQVNGGIGDAITQ